MTPIEQLTKQVQNLEKEVAKLKRTRSLNDAEYLTAAQVREVFGKSESTLRRYRNNGLLTDIRMSVSGRNYEYSFHQLEKLFRAKTKTA
jgi:hypothetical protein